MGIGAGCGGSHDLVGIRSGGNGWGDTDHGQQGGHEEAPANTAQPGEKPDGTPQAQENKEVDAIFGDGRIETRSILVSVYGCDQSPSRTGRARG